MMAETEIDYRPLARARGRRPGAHRGLTTGGLGPLRDTVPFLLHPDPRRIDHRASLRDPFETVHVRRLELRATVTLHLIVDFSASMAHEGRRRRMALVAALYSGLAATARHRGDALGLIGCGMTIHEDFHVRAGRSGARDGAIAEALATFEPQDHQASALATVGAEIGGHGRLVFLISDFHLPLDLIEMCLGSLAHHDIVPVRLTTPTEQGGPPRRGLVRFTDRESGRHRLVLSRPSLWRAWRDKQAVRERDLTTLFEAYGRPPVTLCDTLDPAAIGLAFCGAGP